MKKDRTKQNVIESYFMKKTLFDFDENIQNLMKQYLNSERVCASPDPDALSRAKDFSPIPEDGWEPIELIKEFSETIIPHSINTGSPYFIGHMTSILPNFTRSLGALVNTLNQNMVKMETAKVATHYERDAIAMMHKLMYDQDEVYYQKNAQSHDATLGIITSGGTIANLTALQCARNRYGFKNNIERVGLVTFFSEKEGVGQVVICSRLAHYSVKKVMSILGMGTENLILIEVDEEQKILVSSLKETLEDLKKKSIGVFALIGTAGTTECGSVDPLEKMAELAKEYEIYFHVDAAWGGAVQFSEKHKQLLQGIEYADSITIDGHKQLYLPMGLGIVLFKNHYTASLIENQSEYIIRKGSADLGKRSVEGSRPANMIYLQATLKLMGRTGLKT